MTDTHPKGHILSDYAAGTLSDGMSLLVAGHLTYCPACRSAVADLEALGGAILAASPAPAAPGLSLDAILGRIDALPPGAPARPAPAPARRSVLPAPIRARIGGDESTVPWRFRMPGLAEHVIEGFEGEQVSLLRARPGAGMLAHTHRGEEATLIFSGAMKDGDRIYRRGDVAAADAADDHRPEIVGDELCYCLIVLSGNLRFTGPIGRVLNIFTGQR